MRYVLTMILSLVITFATGQNTATALKKLVAAQTYASDTIEPFRQMFFDSPIRKRILKRAIKRFRRSSIGEIFSRSYPDSLYLVTLKEVTPRCMEMVLLLDTNQVVYFWKKNRIKFEVLTLHSVPEPLQRVILAISSGDESIYGRPYSQPLLSIKSYHGISTIWRKTESEKVIVRTFYEYLIPSSKK